MLEALGASQVLNYIKGLSDEFSFWLVSLEKITNLENEKDVAELRKSLSVLGITWEPIPYWPGGSNYFRNFKNVYSASKRFMETENIKFLHCRSYMPATIAWLLKKSGKKMDYLFDTRGFWFDEKADVGVWKRNGIPYRMAKKLEKTLYQNASAIVMLSKKSLELINKGELFKGSHKLKNIHFIPTCTNLERFSPNYNKLNDPIKIGYVGTAVGWYNFEKTAELLKLIKKEVNYELEIYNGGQHEFIRATLTKYGINKKDYILKKIDFNEIPEKMRNFDISIFFIHPFYSKNASAATKFGELMASGVPILTNKDVGDHEYFIDHYRTGKILDTEKLSEYHYGMILNSLINKENQKNCRHLAEDVFSLQRGVDDYKNIYRLLLK
jgi:glycosyltransferase involved in cell wall biosynthesis